MCPIIDLNNTCVPQINKVYLQSVQVILHKQVTIYLLTTSLSINIVPEHVNRTHWILNAKSWDWSQGNIVFACPVVIVPIVDGLLVQVMWSLSRIWE